MGLQPYLQMQGLVYRVLPRRVPRDEMLHLDRTLFLLDKVYRFRSLGDGSTPMSETGRKLMSNYAASFIQVAISQRQPLAVLKAEIDNLEKPLPDSLVEADSSLVAVRQEELEAKKKEYYGNVDIVINKLDQCVILMPWDWRPRLLRQEILMTHDRLDEATERIEEALRINPEKKEYLKLKARLFDMRGDKAQANALLRELAEDESDPWMSYGLMCKNYEDLGLYDSAIYIMKQFQMMHPGDRRAAATINRLQNVKVEAAKKRVDTSEVKKVDSAAAVKTSG